MFFLVNVLSIATASTATAVDFSGSLQAGFDSFIEKYSVIERDTLDQLAEFRTRLVLRAAGGQPVGASFQAEGTGLVGEETMEIAGRIGGRVKLGRSKFAFDNELTRREYRDNGVYAYANDYTRYNARAQAHGRLGRGIALRLTDRIEVMDFDQRTEFDQDYIRNRFALTAELEAGAATFCNAYAGYTAKVIPDSVGIGYDAVTAGFELRRSLGPNQQVFVTVDAERRYYNDQTVKSPFWSATSSAVLRPLIIGRFGATIENYLEIYLYDDDSAALFDFIENRTALLAQYYQSYALTLGAGPTVGVFSSHLSTEDEYFELGARFRADVTSGDRIWLSAMYEPGFRDYRLEAVDASERVFSDFTYHRLQLLGTCKLRRDTSVNLFVSHEPENHKVEDDDSSATLFSLDVSFRF